MFRFKNISELIVLFVLNLYFKNSFHLFMFVLIVFTSRQSHNAAIKRTTVSHCILGL